MGLILEEVPAFTQTAPAKKCGDLASPIQRVVHGNQSHSETVDQSKQDRNLPSSKKHQKGRPIVAVPKQTAEGCSRQASLMKAHQSHEHKSHGSEHFRHRVRPKSAGLVQARSHRSSRPRSPGSPLPRVAFLANSKCQLGGDPPRQHFPLVGGLQSELDNNEAYLILGDTLKRTGRIDAGHERDVYVRQVAWMAKVHAKAEVIRQELHDEEISQCTFRPLSATQPQSPQACPLVYPGMSQYVLQRAGKLKANV